MASRTIRYLIVPAGGCGKRMKSKMPKQFLNLKGKPVLMHVIGRFCRFDKKIRIIVALPQRYFRYWNQAIKKYRFSPVHVVIAGGRTRFHSVKNALHCITDPGALVAIHDAVRPLISETLISEIFRTAAKHGGAIPVISPGDSIRAIKGTKSTPADRSRMLMVQTPQCFRCDILKKAYNRPYRKSFTDDASVVQDAGHIPILVKGERTNIKITTSEDLRIAEALLR